MEFRLPFFIPGDTAMVMPDELDGYKGCATLREKLARLHDLLRHPSDRIIISEALEQLTALENLQLKPPVKG